MMKKLSLFLAILMLFSLFAFPVSAEKKLSDLEKIHKNLREYLYTPDYRDSEFYPVYDNLMQEIKELIVSDDVSPEVIDKYYYDLKAAYTNLLRDTYDYSSLDGLVAAFEQIPAALFTPESYKKLQSAYDAAQEEISAPTLFIRGNKTTSEMYREHTNQHIQSFTITFKTAFNGLVLVEEPNYPDAQYLGNYAKFIRFCSRPELFGNTTEWATLENALNKAETAAKNGNRAARTTAFKNLKDAYKAACDTTLDFSATENVLNTYKDLRPEDFTISTWNRYQITITDLQISLSKPHFFFIPLGADEKSCKESVKEYFTSLSSAASEKYDELISVETYQKLGRLCNEVNNVTASEGLEIKVTQLKKKIEEGKALLTNESATKAEMEKAIDDIESALETLRFAEKHLMEEQNGKPVQDENAVKYILILSLSSLCISAVLAIYLSIRKYDKIDWTK